MGSYLYLTFYNYLDAAQKTRYYRSHYRLLLRDLEERYGFKASRKVRRRVGRAIRRHISTCNLYVVEF